MAFALVLLVLVFGGGLFLLLKLMSKGRLNRLKQHFPPDRSFDQTRLPSHAAYLRSKHMDIYAIAVPALDTEAANPGPLARDDELHDVSNVRFQLTRH